MIAVDPFNLAVLDVLHGCLGAHRNNRCVLEPLHGSFKRAGHFGCKSQQPCANGMARAPDGTVLVADSILGRIWTLDLVTGDLAVWLDDPAFAADPTGQDLRPGANGLKFHDRNLYVSNSFTGRILVVAIAANGAADGPVRFVAEAAPDRIAALAYPVRAPFAHEVAHLWTNARGPLRYFLTEGWATYAEAAVLESSYGQVAAEKFWADRRRFLSEQPDLLDTPLDQDRSNSGVSYHKGALALLQLEAAVGQRAFDAALSGFIALEPEAQNYPAFLKSFGNWETEAELILGPWVSLPGLPTDEP